MTHYSRVASIFRTMCSLIIATAFGSCSVFVNSSLKSTDREADHSNRGHGGRIAEAGSGPVSRLKQFGEDEVERPDGIVREESRATRRYSARRESSDQTV